MRDRCPRCEKKRLADIKPRECWDRDGIRAAMKCGACLTEFKSYAHGMAEKEPSEYSGSKPRRIQRAIQAERHRLATSWGYVKGNTPSRRSTGAK